MTLAALLKELKGIDPDTADDIGDIVNVISIMSNGSFSSDAYYPDFIIQGCIQRACERRGWFYGQFSMAHPGPFCADVTDSNNVDHYGSGIGDSSAEALLAAYIAAVREEEKR